MFKTAVTDVEYTGGYFSSKQHWECLYFWMQVTAFSKKTYIDTKASGLQAWQNIIHTHIITRFFCRVITQRWAFLLEQNLYRSVTQKVEATKLRPVEDVQSKLVEKLRRYGSVQKSRVWRSFKVFLLTLAAFSLIFRGLLPSVITDGSDHTNLQTRSLFWPLLHVEFHHFVLQSCYKISLINYVHRHLPKYLCGSCATDRTSRAVPTAGKHKILPVS